MVIQDNFSITKLFCDKKITIYVDTKKFQINLPTLRILFENEDWSRIFSVWLSPLDKMQSLCITKIKNSFEFLQNMMFVYGQFKQYRKFVLDMREVLEYLIPGIKIDTKNHLFIINDITINSEIWNYVLYILKLSNGEKAFKPLVFSSEEARRFFEAQQKNEEKIQKVKKSREVEKDALMKNFLFIIYAFPTITIDYLFNQTMAQIQWLQQYAAGAVNYEVNAQAMAAGNMKKGKKLDFFIK